MPTPYFTKVSQRFDQIPAGTMVVLLLSRDSGRMWLELQNQRSIYEDTEDESVIKVYIGAEYDGRQWAAVQPEANEGAERFFILGPPETEDGWLDKSKVSLFQKAIIEKWKNFSGSRASSFAMGTSLGKSMTPASFVAKALAIGFEAVGLPTVAYSGVKLSSWGFHDVLKYAEQHGKLLRFKDRELMTVSDFEDFIELAPHPKFAGKEAPGDNPRDLRRDKDVELILSGQKSGHSGNFAYADELKDFAKLRKVCYGFRGDSRGPVLLKKEFSGAFTPNYTRADHAKKLDRYGELEKVPTQSYESDEDRQKAVAEAEREIAPLKPNFVNAKGRTKSASEAETGALNLEDYIANEFAGGFISLTRYARVARVFASGGGGNAGGAAHRVVLCLLRRRSDQRPAQGPGGLGNQGRVRACHARPSRVARYSRLAQDRPVGNVRRTDLSAQVFQCRGSQGLQSRLPRPLGQESITVAD